MKKSTASRRRAPSSKFKTLAARSMASSRFFEPLESRTLLSAVTSDAASEIVSMSAPPIVAQEIPASSTPIQSAQTVSGTIAAEGQVDAYALQAVGGGAIVVSMGGINQNTLQSHVEILDVNGNSLGSANFPPEKAGHVVTLTVVAPTTGTYYVLASSDNASTGEYNLTAASVPGVQVAGGPIASGQEVNGVIDANLDVYTFNATAGTSVVASIGEFGTDNNPNFKIQIFDKLGHLVVTKSSEFAGAMGTVTFTAPTSGAYYVVASSADGIRGGYQLAVAVAGVTQQQDADSGPVVSGATITGSLDGGVDAFSVNGVAGGGIVVSASGTNPSDFLGMRIQIFDPSGKLVNQSDNPFNGAIATATITAQYTGQYTVVLSSMNGNGGAYKAAIASLPGTQVVDSDGGPIANGQTYAGNIEGDLDVYTFQAIAGGSIVASMGGSNASQFVGSRIQIFDNNGHLLGQAQNTFNGEIATLTVTAPTTGTYYLVCSSISGNKGTYNFSVASLPVPIVADADGGPVSSGQLINGSFDGDLDVYSIQGTAGGSLIASMAGQTANLMISRLQVFDPTGKQIGQSTSPFNGAFALVEVQTPTAGTYFVVASSADGHRDNYKMAIAVANGTQAGGTLAQGVTNGTLAGNLDSYSFTANGGDVISLSLTGTNPSDFVESELYLYDKNGRLVESARSPFDGNIAPITVKAPTTGTYYLVAASSGGNKGAYTLTYNLAAAPAGAVISGTVFNDVNGNGARDGAEQGLGDVTVYLDTNNNGALDTGETSTITSTGGVYTFNGLTGGTYNVRQILPLGYRATLPAPPATLLSVTVAGNQVADGRNFGDSANGVVTGNVFNDVNGNGVKDGGDAGLPGRTVYADLNNNNVQDAGEPSATTDASGNYALPVGPGTFILRNTLTAGTRKSAPTGLQIVTVPPAGSVPGTDFGVTSNIFLGGTAYNDANGNGQQDFNEAGIAGVTINVKSNNIIVATRTTDAQGKWQVRGLSFGTGSVEAVLPSGKVFTNPANGIYTGSSTAGQQIGNVNFGLKNAAPAPAPVFSNAILVAATGDSLLDELA